MTRFPRALLTFILSCLCFTSCNGTKPRAAKGTSKVPLATQPMPSTPSQATQKLVLSNLKEEESFSGAGTAFQFASEPESSREIIFGYSDYPDATGLRVNDRLYKMRHIKSQTIKKGRGRQGLGERVRETWFGDGLTAIFDYTTTSAGEGGVGYKGTLVLTLDGQSSTYKITGGSGC